MQMLLLLLAELLRFENDDELRQRSAKRERHLALVLVQHRGASVLADVEGFIERKANPDRLRNLRLGDLLLVDQQGRGGTLSDATALIGEFHPNNVIAGRKWLIGRH